MKTRKTLKQLIKSYQLILRHLGFELNPHFKETFLHVERMKTNRTKISFIKPEKIKGLEENLEDFKLNPKDQEQREKHFSAVRPSKFLQSMVVNSDKNNNLLTTISEQFSKDFDINNMGYLLRNNLKKRGQNGPKNDKKIIILVSEKQPNFGPLFFEGNP